MARSGAAGEGGGGLDGMVADDDGFGGRAVVGCGCALEWCFVEPTTPPRDVDSRDASVVVRRVDGFD